MRCETLCRRVSAASLLCGGGPRHFWALLHDFIDWRSGDRSAARCTPHNDVAANDIRVTRASIDRWRCAKCCVPTTSGAAGGALGRIGQNRFEFGVRACRRALLARQQHDANKHNRQTNQHQRYNTIDLSTLRYREAEASRVRDE
jgi:hypothetical protein